MTTTGVVEGYEEDTDEEEEEDDDHEVQGLVVFFLRHTFRESVASVVEVAYACPTVSYRQTVSVRRTFHITFFIIF